jgi:uncharacterized membrane protein YfcA
VILPSLWIAVRGHSKATQRALLQSFGFYSQVLTALIFAGIVGLSERTWRALLLCLPIAIAGSLGGFALFRRMSGDAFRRTVLWVVLTGGLGLLVRAMR